MCNSRRCQLWTGSSYAPASLERQPSTLGGGGRPTDLGPPQLQLYLALAILLLCSRRQLAFNKCQHTADPVNYCLITPNTQHTSVRYIPLSLQMRKLRLSNHVIIPWDPQPLVRAARIHTWLKSSLPISIWGCVLRSQS
jgi:hypothetical protein